MAVIWKNGRWVDSITGLPRTSPMNSRYDEGLKSQTSKSLANWADMSNLRLASTTPYTGTYGSNTMPATEDRFSVYNLAGGMNKPGSAANYWEQAARDLGYGDTEKSGWGKYFTEDNLTNLSTLTSAAGDVAKIWSAFQANKLLKKEMEINDASNRANFASNAMNYNDQAEMRNQWLAAQGRDPLYNKVSTTY